MLTSLLKRLFGERQPEADGWLKRATDLQLARQYGEAAAACRARLEREPRDADALQALAAALLAQGHAAEGRAALSEAARVAPGQGQLHATLGRVCAAMGDLEGAIPSLRQALALRPDLHRTADELVALLKATGRYDEAEERCRAVLAAGGDNARRRHALAGALFEQGRVEEAIAELEASLALEPDAPAAHSDLLRALNYADGRDPDAVFHAHCDWAARHANAYAENAPGHLDGGDPHRRLRVGYVSPYFRKHAVTFFLESVIEHCDRESFDVILYADVQRPDEYSARLKAHGAQWRSTVGANDEALAQMVREDRIDILVDLSGHTPGHRLLAFARRPAPVQVTWNGYPNTTGMAAIGYRITDARADPPGLTERLHTERLVRLPEIYMSWRPPADAPDPGPLPALASGCITFGSFNSCYKITPPMIGLWARILDAVPRSRLLLFAVPGGHAKNRLIELFTAEGVASDRFEIRPRIAHEAFLEAHREVDIALDTFPYHGTTTTCFSLWMGVPVVTLAGATHVSRVGLTLLSTLDCANLAPPTAEGYVATAVALASNRHELDVLRGGLRERMLRSPLTDGAACARALEGAYRELWASRCERHPAQ